MLQGREGKIVQVYRKKWVIHIERITREKVNGELRNASPGQTLLQLEALPCWCCWCSCCLPASQAATAVRPWCFLQSGLLVIAS